MESALRVISWGLMGVAVAVLLHFLLYRMTLPLKPFIYQAF
jgi:hypothetical protein